MSASDLIKDLSTLPNIIGQLGLSVAAAQKAFDLDYVENLGTFLKKAMETLGTGPNAAAPSEVVVGLLKELGPSRYQFSETELEFHADLSSSFKTNVALSAGGSIGAVALNASVAVGYGYDYRAAARVRTVLHALPSNTALLSDILARLEKLDAAAVDLPEPSDVDVKLFDTVGKLSELLKKADAED